MSRMLFLRDIQVDIQMRCRDCGHEGVLARYDLERRFGPNYPVLSIAPHYRCSRCHSKEVDSRPVQEAGASFAAATPEPEDFGGALGALQGLLQAVRGESRDVDGVQDLMNDDLLDTMVEEPEEDDSPFERAMAALRGVAHDGEPDDEPGDDEPPREVDDPRTAEVDAFDELLAKLTPARIYDDEDEPKPAPEPSRSTPRDAARADSPLDETLAALRALTSAAEFDAEDEEDDDLRDDDADDVPEDLPEDLDDIPDEEIVSFAIRDPDARGEPEPDLEPDPEEDEDEDEEEEDPVPFRRPPPQPGSLDESLAALRALVEKAAADEPEPSRAKNAAPDKDREPEEPEDDEPAPLAPADTAADTAADEDEPKDDRPPLKTAQEKSLEETLAQLRGMLDLDNPADEGEPVIKPRRR